MTLITKYGEVCNLSLVNFFLFLNNEKQKEPNFMLIAHERKFLQKEPNFMLIIYERKFFQKEPNFMLTVYGSTST